MRVMIVDSEADTRRLMRRLLQDLGYEVIECADRDAVFQTLEAPASSLPDLLLIDDMISGLSGWDVARYVLNDPRWRQRRIPVILTTTMARVETLRRAREIGVAGILAKPFDIHTFEQHITNVLPPDHPAPAILPSS